MNTVGMRSIQATAKNGTATPAPARTTSDGRSRRSTLDREAHVAHQVGHVAGRR